MNEIRAADCMDFDHRDPSTKVAAVSSLVGKAKSMTRILDEIDKCDLVCANCHRIRTYEQGHHLTTRNKHENLR